MSIVSQYLIAGTLLCAVSCSSSKTSPDNPAKEEQAKASANEHAKPEAKPTEQEEPTQQEEEPNEQEEIDPAHMEHDPNATSSLKPVDLHGKLPDDMDKDKLHGKFHKSMAWTDKDGLQAIIFGISTQEKGDSVSSLMVADFMLREGDAWTSQRKFKASVKDCEFDTELKAFTGPWSLTDLDNNGIAEVSFAWRVGCRSDFSPVSHKVFITGWGKEAGVQKYVLRGTTSITGAGGGDEGEGFKADSAFKKVPKSFLEHAEKIWAKTSVENFD